eukprot:Tamp_15636.p6 GENE.Tamp_15636~~Tamp_15636.p6  ORF type:complete len:111 (+),score=21.31 Tamp_15636:69-401(+)
MQAARAVTRSISGVASGVADSAAAQDDADEERRRNARASWKRATTKVASALRLARGAQREGEAAGALDGMEENLELASGGRRRSSCGRLRRTTGLCSSSGSRQPRSPSPT